MMLSARAPGPRRGARDGSVVGGENVLRERRPGLRVARASRARASDGGASAPSRPRSQRVARPRPGEPAATCTAQARGAQSLGAIFCISWTLTGARTVPARGNRSGASALGPAANSCMRASVTVLRNRQLRPVPATLHRASAGVVVRSRYTGLHAVLHCGEAPANPQPACV
jgi:hypothetical protein